MSEDTANTPLLEELISIPSFLSNNYGVSLAASCSCMAEQGDPCGTGEWCSECSCQGWECGESCSQSCSESCSESCGDAQAACGECAASVEGGCSGGQCGNSESCGGCEDCMGCESYCQISYQATYVTCTKHVLFYNQDGSYKVDELEEDEDNLEAGKKYTPSASSHMPDYDSSIYELYEIIYYGSEVTTVSMTCPSDDFDLYYYFRAKSILKWDWSIKNGPNATPTETYNSYKAIINKSSVSSFTYGVWNDLVDKVVEVWHAQGGYFDTKYLSYDETLMTPKNKVLTAKRFNSLNYNIAQNAPSGTGIGYVYPGDVVKGSYFTTLATAINEWIDTL